MPQPAPVKLAVRIATAIVTTRRLRRQAMVYAILVAAAQCFAGTVLLPPSMNASPWFLLTFWGSCLLLVLIALGLAILDILKLRQQLAAELRDLRENLRTPGHEDPEEQEKH